MGRARTTAKNRRNRKSRKLHPLLPLAFRSIPTRLIPTLVVVVVAVVLAVLVGLIAILGGQGQLLAEVGIGAADLEDMVEECLVKYPRPNNPVPFERERLLALYRAFHDGDIDAAVGAGRVKGRTT